MVLREALTAVGVVVAPQRRLDGVRVDFAVGEQVAVLVDGCFWHGCPRHYVMPRSNADFWAGKLRENVERDARQTAALIRGGWIVVRVWEHAVFEQLDELVSKLRAKPVTAEVNNLRVVRVEAVGEELPRIERRLLVDLTDPTVVVDTVTGRRVTAKWRRPTAFSRLPPSAPR